MQLELFMLPLGKHAVQNYLRDSRVTTTRPLRWGKIPFLVRDMIHKTSKSRKNNEVNHDAGKKKVSCKNVDKQNLDEIN